MRAMTVTVAVVLALVLAIGIFCGLHSRNTSERYKVRIEEVATAILQEKWEESLRLIREAEQDWEDESGTLAMWVNHEDVDVVSVGMAQLRVSIEEGERYHALLYAAELEEALTLIYQRDAFSLKNIL